MERVIPVETASGFLLLPQVSGDLTIVWLMATETGQVKSGLFESRELAMEFAVANFVYAAYGCRELPEGVRMWWVESMDRSTGGEIWTLMTTLRSTQGQGSGAAMTGVRVSEARVVKRGLTRGSGN